MPKELISLVDTETTGLVEAKGTRLDLQPYVIEICIIMYNHKYKEVKKISTLIKPPVAIPPIITKITGINDSMVRNSPTFDEVLPAVRKILKRSDVLVAQNLPFDKEIIQMEFDRRNSKVKWPKKLFCTVEQSLHLRGMRLKSTELFDMAKGKEIKGIHRAEADVGAMLQYYKMIKSGMIPAHLKGLRK